MNKRRVIRIALVIITIGINTAAGIGFYLFNKPHRNVAESEIDFHISAAELVDEYLNNATLANQKYLADDGESKILAITGTVSAISLDLNNQYVVLLKETSQHAGVSCTFASSTNDQAKNLTAGHTATIKGVIRSGAEYDEDLDLYEDVIVEKCSITQ